MTTFAEDLIERRSYQRTAMHSALARLELEARHFAKYAEVFDLHSASLQSALLNARLALSLQMEGQNNEEQDNGNS